MLLEVLLLLANVGMREAFSAHHEHALVALGGGVDDTCVVPLIFS